MAAAGVSATVGRSPWDGTPVSVVEEAGVQDLTTAGIMVWDAAGGVAAALGPLIAARAHTFVDSASAEWVAGVEGWNSSRTSSKL